MLTEIIKSRLQNEFRVAGALKLTVKLRMTLNFSSCLHPQVLGWQVHLCSTRDLPQGLWGLARYSATCAVPSHPGPSPALAPAQFRCLWTSWSLLFLPNRAVSDGPLLWLFSSVTACVYAGSARMMRMCLVKRKKQRASGPLSSLSKSMASGNGPWRSAQSFCCHLPHRSKDLTPGSQPLSVLLSLKQVRNTVLETYNLFAWFRLHKYSLNYTQTELDLFLVVWFDFNMWPRHILQAHRQVLCLCGNFLKKLAGERNDNYCRLGSSLRVRSKEELTRTRMSGNITLNLFHIHNLLTFLKKKRGTKMCFWTLCLQTR